MGCRIAESSPGVIVDTDLSVLSQCALPCLDVGNGLIVGVEHVSGELIPPYMFSVSFPFLYFPFIVLSCVELTVTDRDPQVRCPKAIFTLQNMH